MEEWTGNFLLKWFLLRKCYHRIFVPAVTTGRRGSYGRIGRMHYAVKRSAKVQWGDICTMACRWQILCHNCHLTLQKHVIVLTKDVVWVSDRVKMKNDTTPGIVQKNSFVETVRCEGTSKQKQLYHVYYCCMSYIWQHYLIMDNRGKSRHLYARVNPATEIFRAEFT